MRLIFGPARRRLIFGLASLLHIASTSGCFAPVAALCPKCQELSVEQRPQVPATVRTVFLLLPGLLGYGWEWNGAQDALRRYPESAVLVYSWEPWHSLHASGARLADHLAHLRANLPPSVRELVVIAHSAAGLLAIDAAGSLPSISPGQPHIRILSIGAPLAGMGRNPWGGADNRHTPLPIAIGGHFTLWPEPAPGVSLEIFPTGGDDPVMQKVFGHDPGDRAVLPRGAKVIALPPRLDHNYALTWLCEWLLREAGVR